MEFSGIPLEVYWDIKARSARLKKADNPDDYPQLYDFLRQYAVDYKVEIDDEQDIEKIVSMIDNHPVEPREPFWVWVKNLFR